MPWKHGAGRGSPNLGAALQALLPGTLFDSASGERLHIDRARRSLVAAVLQTTGSVLVA